MTSQASHLQLSSGSKKVNFEARGSTIKAILTAARVYEIPRFQRDFSWDKKNYDEFLNDMLAQISFEGSQFKNSQYYLGSMLFLVKLIVIKWKL